MITPLPNPPLVTDSPTDFQNKASTFLAALPTFAIEANGDIAGITNTAATAMWVATTTYSRGNVVWSPATYLNYRLKSTSLTGAAGNADPSVDTTNWAQATGTGNVSAGTSPSFTNLTASGNVGIGTNAPVGPLQVVGTVRFGAGPTDATNAAVAMYSQGTGISIEAFQGNNSGTKRNLYLAAFGGNVGIGATGPSYPLHVNSGGNSGTLSLSPSGVGGGASYILMGNSDSGGTAGPVVISSANRVLQFGVGTSFSSAGGGTFSEYARIDSSGNLGLGVTPSAWDSSYKAIRVNNITVASQDQTGGAEFSKNSYVASGGANTYIATGFATKYEQVSGAHRWYTAPSGTAGNAIAFTQAMTLDASGNLGIGTTSPGVKLDVNGALRVGLASNPTTIASNSQFYDQSGVGPTISGFNFTVRTGNPTPSETFRIDSSGNLFVNATAQSGDRPNAPGIQVLPVGDIKIRVATDSQPALQFYSPTGGGSAVGSVTVGASSTAYNTSSDYRLKQDIAPMTGALAKVAALKPVTYKWKATGEADEGFIAHELAEVVPQCVTGEKDAVDAEGNPQYQGIDTSFLVATLTAAIQEQQAIIEQLKADVAALKGKV